MVIGKDGFFGCLLGKKELEMKVHGSRLQVGGKRKEGRFAEDGKLGGGGNKNTAGRALESRIGH